MSGPSTVAKRHMNWLLRHCDPSATERLAAAVNALLHPAAQTQTTQGMSIAAPGELTAEQVDALQQKWTELMADHVGEGGAKPVTVIREAAEHARVQTPSPISMPTAVVALCAVLGDVISTTDPKQQHLLVIAIGALLGENVNACNLHRAAAALSAEVLPEERRH